MLYWGYFLLPAIFTWAEILNGLAELLGPSTKIVQLGHNGHVAKDHRVSSVLRLFLSRDLLTNISNRFFIL